MNLRKTLRLLFAVMVMTIFVYSCDNNKFQNEISEEVHDITLYAPAFSNIDMPFDNYEISADKGGKITYNKTGSSLDIPKNAFLDKNGEIVKGNVKIRYRELHNPLDFMIAGVPMNIDSGGQSYYFESSGMYEIYATQNDGTPVFANPDNPIALNYRSISSAAPMNIYDFDTVSKRWVETGKNEAIEAEVEPFPNVKEPSIDDVNKRNFVLSPIWIENQPELKPYMDMEFEPLSGTFPINVSSVIITESKKHIGAYEFLFSTTANTGGYSQAITFLELTAYPVYKEGKKYDEALKSFRKKHKDILEKIEERRKTIQANIDVFNKYVAREKGEKETKIKELQKKFEEEKEADRQTMILQANVFRSLTINSFGLKNCDIIERIQGELLAFNYLDNKNNKLQFNRTFVIVNNMNTTVSIIDRFKINANNTYNFFGITANNELYTSQGLSGTSILNGSKTADIKFKKYEGSIENIDDVKNAILN